MEPKSPSDRIMNVVLYGNPLGYGARWKKHLESIEELRSEYSDDLKEFVDAQKQFEEAKEWLEKKEIYKQKSFEKLQIEITRQEKEEELLNEAKRLTQHND